MMKIANAVEPHVRDLLAQAAAWRLLGLLFERPREGWWREVEGLCREVADVEIRAAAEAARAGATEGLYLALLGPGAAVSPREVSYRGMEDPGRILADITSFYEAFAFHPQTEEPPDHVSVEAGFLGYVHLKEAYARLRGNEEEAEVASLAAGRFLTQHLSLFASPFAARLETTGPRYLSLAATALARRAGPRTDTRVAAKLSTCSCDGCPLECGEE